MDLWVTLVDATVQALVLIVGAAVALKLERWSRYRREVEELMLQVNSRWGQGIIALTKGPKEPSWGDALTPIHDRLDEIEVK